MKHNRLLYLIIISFLLTISLVEVIRGASVDDNILSYIVDPKSENIDFYWKDDEGEIIGSLGNLEMLLDSEYKQLIFATNGGMYNMDRSPKGLFIYQSETITPLDKSSGQGNFYLKPNGVFYITTDNVAAICKTDKFKDKGKIKYATQSGPMLVIDGKIHPSFKKGSSNLHIRNGVGILPDGSVLFAMSKTKVNFYDFASYFQKLGCKNALYFDGYVSRTYLPEKNWIQKDGNFGVIIGVTKILE